MNLGNGTSAPSKITGNKLNSFRGGGPIRATQNAIENPVPSQINQSAIVKMSSGINGSGSAGGSGNHQRPSSSKPIMKNSFNNDTNG
jgi:hypothetical protein